MDYNVKKGSEVTDNKDEVPPTTDRKFANAVKTKFGTVNIAGKKQS
jgi:hypothetical protein